MNQPFNSDSGIWSTSVTDLLNIFRDSLISLIPTFDRARIVWTGPDTYDAWDDISETLFRHLVTIPIRYSLPEEYIDIVRFSDYEFSYESYEELSYIEVLGGNAIDPHIHKVFHSFETISDPFDNINYQLLDSIGRIVNRELELLPFSEVKFKAQYCVNKQVFHEISELKVVL